MAPAITGGTSSFPLTKMERAGGLWLVPDGSRGLARTRAGGSCSASECRESVLAIPQRCYGCYFFFFCYFFSSSFPVVVAAAHSAEVAAFVLAIVVVDAPVVSTAVAASYLLFLFFGM